MFQKLLTSALLFISIDFLSLEQLYAQENANEIIITKNIKYANICQKKNNKYNLFSDIEANRLFLSVVIDAMIIILKMER